MPNFTVYVEGNRIKAWDLTNENYKEVDDLLGALGLDIVAKCYFSKEADAKDYGRFLSARKKIK